MTHAPAFLSLLIGPFRSAAARYGGVLDLPETVAFSLSAAIARLGVAGTGLGLLLSVRHATGSFALAGAATAAFAVAEAAGGPQVARLVDRFGQTRTVPVVVLLHVAAVASVLLAVGSAPTGVLLAVGSAPTGVLLAAVVVAGASIPQPGALSAARWSGLLTDPSALRTAFALEANVNDVVFLTAPVLVTLASTSLFPSAGSVVAVALVAGGCGALSLQRRTAPSPHRVQRGESDRRRTSLLAPDFVAALGVVFGLGCFFGAVPLLVTAAAAAVGRQPVAGLVLALSSGASILAGIAYGSLRSAPRPRRVQLLASVVLTLAVLIGVAWPTLPGLVVMLVVGGTAIAPLLVSSSHIVQETVRRSELTQGFTWVNSSSAAGIAVGAGFTGAALAHGGVPAAMLPLLVLVLVAVASAVWAVLRAG
jgi:hypothetical protein